MTTLLLWGEGTGPGLVRDMFQGGGLDAEGGDLGVDGHAAQPGARVALMGRGGVHRELCMEERGPRLGACTMSVGSLRHRAALGVCPPSLVKRPIDVQSCH